MNDELSHKGAETDSVRATSIVIVPWVLKYATLVFPLA